MPETQPQVALVVDDEFNNRDFAEKLLERAGVQVYTAETANEALQVLEANPHITIALIDHQLPDMTGIKLIKKIRQFAPELTLIMATVHDNSALIEQAFEAGVNMFLVKPNGFIELYRALQTHDHDSLLREPLVIDSYGPRKYRRVG